MRLFVPEDKDLGIRPERLLREIGETEFIRRHQCPPALAGRLREERVRRRLARADAAVPGAPHPQLHPGQLRRDRPGQRAQVPDFEDGTRSYFPVRVPKTVKFTIDEDDPDDQYARLYAPDVVDAINGLTPAPLRAGQLHRDQAQPSRPTAAEKKQLEDLSRAGKRLMGFCRTNLFKRLESSGQAFIQSVERHILRNYVFLHAIEKGLPLPIGTQDAALLDSRVHDEDEDIGDVMDAFD